MGNLENRRPLVNHFFKKVCCAFALAFGDAAAGLKPFGKGLRIPNFQYASLCPELISVGFVQNTRSPKCALKIDPKLSALSLKLPYINDRYTVLFAQCGEANYSNSPSLSTTNFMFSQNYFFNDLGALLSLSADWETMQSRFECQPFNDRLVTNLQESRFGRCLLRQYPEGASPMDGASQKKSRPARDSQPLLRREECFYGKLPAASTAF